MDTTAKSNTCPKCGAEIDTALTSKTHQSYFACGSHIHKYDGDLVEHEQCLRRQLAAAQAATRICGKCGIVKSAMATKCAGCEMDRLEKELATMTADPGQALLDRLTDAIGLLQEIIATDDTPSPNCSCHICPPCQDCVEYGSRRELIARARVIVDQPKTT